MPDILLDDVFELIDFLPDDEQLLVSGISEPINTTGLVDGTIQIISEEKHIFDPFQEPPDPMLPYQGEGYISGITKVKGEIHPNATLSLFCEDGFYIGDTISDEDGIYTFTNLNPQLKFFVIAKIELWEYRVLSQISPKV